MSEKNPPTEPKALPKRFYKDATLGQDEVGAFRVLLDGRAVKTPTKSPLIISSHAMAKKIVSEWAAQDEFINMASMPITQRRMITLDRGDIDGTHWQGLTKDYLGTDLLCYRSSDKYLNAKQAEMWQPYLDWVNADLGIGLNHTDAILAIEQPASAFDAVDQFYAKQDDPQFEMASCIAAATEMMGSAVLALALWQQHTTFDNIFNAARIDEHFQAERWGWDEEAQTAENNLKADLSAVFEYMGFLKK